jgi:hypothetical protein
MLVIAFINMYIGNSIKRIKGKITASSIKHVIQSNLVPFYRLLPFGITGSNDFVQSEENTRVFRIPSM